MTRYLLDTNVFVYARGRDHPYREPCRSVLRAGRDGRIRVEASVEVVQEFTHLLLRRTDDREQALAEAAEVRDQCQLHPFDGQVLQRALRLLQQHTDLGVRDAVHAATALHAGIGRIISVDRAFDAVADLDRVDPAAPGSPWV